MPNADAPFEKPSERVGVFRYYLLAARLRRVDALGREQRAFDLHVVHILGRGDLGAPDRLAHGLGDEAHLLGGAELLGKDLARARHRDREALGAAGLPSTWRRVKTVACGENDALAPARHDERDASLGLLGRASSALRDQVAEAAVRERAGKSLTRPLPSVFAMTPTMSSARVSPASRRRSSADRSSGAAIGNLNAPQSQAIALLERDALPPRRPVSSARSRSG
jgi:hypothetical protein